jgi:hypothetical protein
VKSTERCSRSVGNLRSTTPGRTVGVHRCLVLYHGSTRSVWRWPCLSIVDDVPSRRHYPGQAAMIYVQGSTISISDISPCALVCSVHFWPLTCVKDRSSNEWYSHIHCMLSARRVTVCISSDDARHQVAEAPRQGRWQDSAGPEILDNSEIECTESGSASSVDRSDCAAIVD